MGEVVDLSKWRENRTKGGLKIKPLTLDVMASIEALLHKADAARASIGLLGTVRLREGAVLDSLRYREMADKLAKEHGLSIMGGDGEYIVARI